jgi:hypothetical protein
MLARYVARYPLYVIGQYVKYGNVRDTERFTSVYVSDCRARCFAFCEAA